MLLRDALATSAASKAKLLFIDDSVLTLAEKTRMVVREFLTGRGDGARSIFNLLEGQMRSVVGKQRFEVQTPTAVAAARGTVILFETGVAGGRRFTRIDCSEGRVEVRSISTGETALLTAGMEVVIVEGEPLPAPAPAQPATLKDLLEATSMAGLEITVPPAPKLPATAGAAGVGGGKPAGSRALAPDALSAWLPLASAPLVQQQQPSAPPTRAVITINIH